MKVILQPWQLMLLGLAARIQREQRLHECVTSWRDWTATEWLRLIATGFYPCLYPAFFGRDSVISRSGTRKSSDANVLAVTQGFDFAQR